MTGLLSFEYLQYGSPVASNWVYSKCKATEDNSGGKNKIILLLPFARKREDDTV